MAFKIYYDDGTEIASWDLISGDGTAGIPRGGIIAIIQDDVEDGWTLLTGHEYYVRWQGVWSGATYHQLLDYLVERGLIKLTPRGIRIIRPNKAVLVDDAQFKFFLDNLAWVLTGRMTTSAQQTNVLNKAIRAAEFGTKRQWGFQEKPLRVRSRYAKRRYEVDQPM